MRLICPNCGAQYEVPVDVIPTGGRDVQCSNCGHTWFQAHPDDDPALAEDLHEPVHDSEWEDGPEPDDFDEADAASVAQGSAFPTDAAVAEPQADAAAATPVQENAPPRARSLDPDVADLLREEREFEVRKRAAESGAFESQPELGLTEPDEDEQARRARESRERMARMRGEDADPGLAAAAAATAAGSRRELLPDVEEINQTLRSANEPRVVDEVERREPPDSRREGGGFGKGFFLIILLAAAAIAVYVLAPQITEAVPQLGATLEAYVAQVDRLRLWLDAQITALTTTLDGMSSEAAEGADADAPADAETDG